MFEIGAHLDKLFRVAVNLPHKKGFVEVSMCAIK